MEMIVSILVNLVTDPINLYVVTPIKQHISYAFTCDTKVQRLHNEVEQLKNKRVRLQQSVDAATRNGEEIYPNVTKWLTIAEKDIEEAENLIQEKEEAKKKCFVGFCPNLKTRYQLSKKAYKKASVMAELLQDAQGSDPISFRQPLLPIVEDNKYSRGDALPSRMLILHQIMDALKDPNLNIIGVYGMGGIGKTTLAKEVLGQAAEQKLFETVILVAVSQTPELGRIQGEIADFLGLEFHAKEVPGRASQLHQALKKVKALIILDDLWQKLDLNAVGIPSGDACGGCKILLTSRRKHVLSNEMCTQKEFLLDVLEPEETWRLFEMSVSKAKDPELRAIATEIAKKCAGLPLLILIVATDLRNKGIHAWKDKLIQLSCFENKEIYEQVKEVIKSSYGNLIDEEAKSLFLLCPQFGNPNIRIQDLLVYCVGLGLFKHMDSIEGARNRVLTLIDKLKDECLLLDGDKAGFVKIHDLVRDIALTIASDVSTSKVTSTELRNKDCTRISLRCSEIAELPEVLECPKAELFSLFMSYHNSRFSNVLECIPNSFFAEVTQLKVLHFTEVNFVSGFPSSLGFLTGLQTLYLERCRLDNLAIIAELKQLELLSLADSKIAEFPREIKALTRLKLLDLRGCWKLRVIPANVLSNLCLLEELYMLNSFHGWELEGNASLVELKNLSRLTTLEIQVEDGKLLPKDWFFNGLQNYKIHVGHWRWSKEYKSSRVLQLELTTNIGLMHRIKEFLKGTEVLYLGELKGTENLLFDYGQLETDSFGKLRFLEIRNCHSLKNLFPFSCHKCLPQLQEIEVKSCDNMEAIVGEGSEGEVMEFPQLTSFTLEYLPNLIGFCKTSGMVSFPTLTSLKVYLCNSLKYVFTTSMVKSLRQLKRLEISHCYLIEEIILSNEIEEESIDMVVFPELGYLQLGELRNMKRFSSRYPIEFPKLRELRIKFCDALKNFVSKFSDTTDDETLFNELATFSSLEIIYFYSMNNLRYIWHQQFADDDSFSKLKSLEIVRCSKLSVVFPSNLYRRFQRLESLEISNCGGVQEIFEYQRFCIEKETSLQAFSLRRISISDLPSLKHILTCGLLQLQHLQIRNCGAEMIIAEAKNEGSDSATGHTFECPKLEYLEASHCDKLIKFGFKIPEVIPNLEVLKLNHISLKAIQYDHVLPVVSVWQLQRVTLEDLKEESIPFLFGLLRQIYSLEYLVIDRCSLGDIFSVGEEQRLIRLKHLELKNIRNLRHIIRKKDSQELNPILQHLHTLNVDFCFDLMNIAPSSASFQNLTTLKVDSCPKMTSLVTASMAKSMMQLVKLKVFDCEMMKEIVANNDDDDADVIIFKKLEHLELIGLGMLNSFCSGNYIFEFPLLEQVVIQRCKQMKIFCGGVLITPKLDCPGNLNATIESQVQKNGWVHIRLRK
ncbi:probable disease resistance protein At4g27220 isoform X2 [Euphorbia lathyris]|uniref:probable disease resistance protein At4g27220 isoform X2 n=1 Tax=Euphorbia lathyris TaxID=212925 RepID=UPI003314348F